jgi:tetratricopeptide (TPR) repeat protein
MPGTRFPDPIRPIALAALLISLVTSGLAAQTGRLRNQVEAERVRLEAASREAPGDPAARRAYATVLFQLGDVWQAREVIAPLAAADSAPPGDVHLAARLAYLTGNYPEAEELFQRLQTLADSDSLRTEAVRGLALAYYQQNRYDRARELPLTGLDPEEGIGSLLAFMQKFEGTPYGIEWDSEERVAHLPMLNDITAPSGLPELRLEINGHPVTFILDSGGDRLYLDEGLAEQLGIRVVTKRRSRYAYTGGETVDEPLGVADRVKMGEVTLRNVPVIVAQWKARGIKSDGVLTTQMLKQFLATVDYTNRRITLRERNERGRRQLMESFGGRPPHELRFFLTNTHLMFAKGSINGHRGMNLLLDSGLALSLPLVIINETAEMLGLPRTPVPNTKYYTVPLEAHGLEGLERGSAQAVGNIIIERDPYWSNGFMFDGLISHQYLRHLGSWTIDFDRMTYYFPR